MSYTPVSPPEFAEMHELDDWRYLLGAIVSTYVARSFPAAAELVGAISAAAEEAEHHPDIDLRYPGRVRVVLTTHAVGGVTTRDVDLARTISDLAMASGATAEPLAAATVEVAIDTLDADRIRPFWQAVLGYREVHGNLVDPQRHGPPFWFQTMDEPRAERNRFHIDVTVPHDIAQERIEAALAAGGRLVTDRYARAWWVLADPDGNEACICTWQDRD